MQRCSLLRHVSAAAHAVEDDEPSITSPVGIDIVLRRPVSDVTGTEDRHTIVWSIVEDSTSAEERTAEQSDRTRLIERNAEHSDMARLSSKSGAVRKPRKGPLLTTTRPHQPGQSVERIPGDPSLHRSSDIRPRGAGVSPDTLSV
jgi:hypothetical protein